MYPLDPKYCIHIKEGAEKGFDSDDGNSGSWERKKTSEGPLWVRGNYREFLGIAVFRFYIVLAFIGEVSSLLKGAGHYCYYCFPDFLISGCVYFDLYYQ